MESTEIKKALSRACEKDLFLTEVKNGSTYFPPAQGLLKFDAVAIARSYTKPRIRIFEVKISRSDFLRDNKWNLYLQYCHEFYFACPAGMIRPDELPLEVGLMWYDPDKKTVRTKRKAAYRPEPGADMEDMYKYILYSAIKSDRTPFFNARLEYAKAYLEDRAYRRNVGISLGSRLAGDLQAAIEETECLKKQVPNREFLNRLIQLLIRKHVIRSYQWDPDRATSERQEYCYEPRA